MRHSLHRNLAAGLAITLLLSLGVDAQSRRHNKDKKSEDVPISVLDSTDAKWGMRSVNASVYQGLPMNAVMLERGRTPLPESFPRYQAKPLGNDIVVRSKDAAPTTIRVNGVETPIIDDNRP